MTSTGAGARVPTARLRLRRRLTASPSSEPLGLLAVDHHALPAQQDMKTAIAEPATLVRLLAQLLTKLGIIVPRGTVTHGLAIGIDDTAQDRKSTRLNSSH